MSIALVAHTQIAPGSGGGTTTGINTTGTNLLVVALDSYAGVTLPNISNLSDSKGNTWHACTNQNVSASSAQLFYAINPTVGSGHTVTFSQASQYPVISFYAFSGGDTSAPLDVQNGATGASVGSLQTGSVTPSQDNSLVFCAGTWDNNDTATWDSPFSTNQAGTVFSSGNNEAGLVSYEIQTTATARNPKITLTGSIANIAAVIAVFKPAAAGGILRPFGLEARMANGMGLNGGMAG